MCSGTQPLKQVGPSFVGGLLALEHVISHHKHRMDDRQDRSRLAAPRGRPSVLRTQVGTHHTRGGVSRRCKVTADRLDLCINTGHVLIEAVNLTPQLGPPTATMRFDASRPTPWLDVGLSAGRRFDVLGIAYDHSAHALHGSEDRFPRVSRPLDRHRRAPARPEPIRQRHQVSGHHPQGARLRPCGVTTQTITVCLCTSMPADCSVRDRHSAPRVKGHRLGGRPDRSDAGVRAQRQLWVVPAGTPGPTHGWTDVRAAWT